MKLTKLILPACMAAMLSACVVDGYADDRRPYDRHERDSRIDRERDRDDYRDRDRRERDAGERRHSHDLDRRDSRSRVRAFTCRNAFDLRVEHRGGDRVAVRYGLRDGMSRAVLHSARSGSGELYVSDDRKVEWHEKGGEGTLTFTDRYGNVTDTVCREVR